MEKVEKVEKWKSKCECGAEGSVTFPSGAFGVKGDGGGMLGRLGFRFAALILAVLPFAACGEAKPDGPDDTSLKDSFVQQISTNKFVRDFQRNGDDLVFTAPDGQGGDAKWRIHIDLATVMEYPSEKQPYKGTINSSWFANDQPRQPSGTESNLPIELLDNGVSQDCWAFWDPATKSWGWE